MFKVLFLILFFILGVPFILSVILMGVGVGTQAYYVGTILHKLGFDESSPAKSEWNVVNIRRENHLASAYRTIVEPERLQSGRRVSVSAVIMTSDLAVDQRLVPASDIDNQMRLYAPRFATEECKRIKEIFAKDCVVERTDVRKLDSKIFEISAVMTFTVKEPFGSVPEGAPLAFIEVDQHLTNEGALGRSVARRDQADLRMTMYRAAVSACQKVRASNGNCAIRQVSIDLVRTQGVLSTPRLRGSATLSMLKEQ